MKLTKTLSALVAACMLASVVALAGCMAPSQQTNTDENAAAHRAYMAQVGQRADELDAVLTEFQTAVGAEDVVAMKAAAARAATIVEDVKTTEAPEKLAEVKENYAAGLDQLQQALTSYTQLYGDLEAGAVTETDYQARLAEVQTVYDAGIQAVKAADEKAVELAKE